MGCLSTDQLNYFGHGCSTHKSPWVACDSSSATRLPPQEGTQIQQFVYSRTPPAAALVLEEVVAGRQPGDMVPQLPGVLSGRHRGDDRPKESAPPIDRECWHAKGLQPLDPVLVLREDTFFYPWLGCGFGAPGWIEAGLTQGALDHRSIGERFLAFVAGLSEGHIEP